MSGTDELLIEPDRLAAELDRARSADPARRPLAAGRPPGRARLRPPATCPARSSSTWTRDAVRPARRRPAGIRCPTRPRCRPRCGPAGVRAGSPGGGVRRRRRAGRRPGLVDAALGRAPAGAGARRRLRRPGAPPGCPSRTEAARRRRPATSTVRPGALPVLDAAAAAARAADAGVLLDVRAAAALPGRDRADRPGRRAHPGRGQPARRRATWTPTGGFPAADGAAGALRRAGVDRRRAGRGVLRLRGDRRAGGAGAAPGRPAGRRPVRRVVERLGRRPDRPVATGRHRPDRARAVGSTVPCDDGPCQTTRGGVGRVAARLRHGRPSARPGPGRADHRAGPGARRPRPARGDAWSRRSRPTTPS